mmetsp:Transcript_9277/g.36069  ORF Transcript_9277/g.36069 Transcript_9277/m.36069 type:complete len:228 (-) Transcript_9277:735-1418(-)
MASTRWSWARRPTRTLPGVPRPAPSSSTSTPGRSSPTSSCPSRLRTSSRSEPRAMDATMEQMANTHHPRRRRRFWWMRRGGRRTRSRRLQRLETPRTPTGPGSRTTPWTRRGTSSAGTASCPRRWTKPPAKLPRPTAWRRRGRKGSRPRLAKSWDTPPSPPTRSSTAGPASSATGPRSSSTSPPTSSSSPPHPRMRPRANPPSPRTSSTPPPVECSTGFDTPTRGDP